MLRLNSLTWYAERKILFSIGTSAMLRDDTAWHIGWVQSSYPKVWQKKHHGKKSRGRIMPASADDFSFSVPVHKASLHVRLMEMSRDAYRADMGDGVTLQVWRTKKFWYAQIWGENFAFTVRHVGRSGVLAKLFSSPLFIDKAGYYHTAYAVYPSIVWEFRLASGEIQRDVPRPKSSISWLRSPDTQILSVAWDEKFSPPLAGNIPPSVYTEIDISKAREIPAQHTGSRLMARVRLSDHEIELFYEDGTRKVSAG